jgi:RNA polymerase subunit RPABC4/transcription elongation factor Spt4
MAEKTCPTCGRTTTGDANFCSHCGARLDADESTITFVGLETLEESIAELGELPDLEKGQGLLIVVRGPNQGSRFFLDTDVTTVGRHPDSDIQLDDVTVSRRHAELRRDPAGSFSIKDAGSLNGTYVNRRRVDEYRLSAGDEIQIGRYRLVFVTAGDQGSRPASDPA